MGKVHKSLSYRKCFQSVEWRGLYCYKRMQEVLIFLMQAENLFRVHMLLYTVGQECLLNLMANSSDHRIRISLLHH